MEESSRFLAPSAPPNPPSQFRRRVSLLVASLALISLFIFVIFFFQKKENFPKKIPENEDVEVDDHTKQIEYFHTSFMNITMDTIPTHDVAPRTAPSLDYNEISNDRKYLLFTPVGGMSNQVKDLANVMVAARNSNRVLLVPMFGKHSNMLSGYHHLTVKDLFPADRIFDFQAMNEYCTCLPLNITITEFIARFVKGNGNSLRVVRRIDRMDNGLPTFVAGLKDDVKLVFVDAIGIGAHWYHIKTIVGAKHYLPYSPHLRRLAEKIANQTMGPSFNAMHGRLGDYMHKWAGTSSMLFVHKAREQHWNSKMPIYLASDDAMNRFFDPLKEVYQVKTYHDFDQGEVRQFLSLFPTQAMQGDMFGVLDKLICAAAKDFIGSGFSTFTVEIRFIRGNSKWLFPELPLPVHPGTNVNNPEG